MVSFQLIPLLLAFSVAFVGTESSRLSNSRIAFSSTISVPIRQLKPGENIIISPSSIHTCLTIVLLGAKGESENELRKVLQYGNATREEIIKDGYKFTQRIEGSQKNKNGVQLNLVNRVYVNQNYKLKTTFNEVVNKSFRTSAENINVSDSANAVKKINSFVEESTQHKIKNILSNDAIDDYTTLVLVNAIYFKGAWENQFHPKATKKRLFYNYGKIKVSVDTMHKTDTVLYGEFPELDAKIINLPYKNSKISMILILPNAVNGLENLEQKLVGKNLNHVIRRLSKKRVLIFLPKFRIEFNIDLVEPLKKLGVTNIFSDDAYFSELLENDLDLKVSAVQHKAFIDVNERGSEAAAATAANLFQRMLISEFNANRPFFFAIRSPDAIHFVGRVLSL